MFRRGNHKLPSNFRLFTPLFVAQGRSFEPSQSPCPTIWPSTAEGGHHSMTYWDWSLFKWATNWKSVSSLPYAGIAAAYTHREREWKWAAVTEIGLEKTFVSTRSLLRIEALTAYTPQIHTHTHTKNLMHMGKKTEHTHAQENKPTHAHSDLYLFLDTEFWIRKVRWRKSENELEVKGLQAKNREKTFLWCFVLSLPPSTSSLPKCLL